VMATWADLVVVGMEPMSQVTNADTAARKGTRPVNAGRKRRTSRLTQRRLMGKKILHCW
jgi:hypothetical protein